MRLKLIGPVSALTALLWAGTAAGHGEEQHGAAAEPAKAPAKIEAALPSGPAPAFPFQIGGGFSLTDHRGKAVTDRDFRGAHMLVFFGYASCESICTVGLNRMTAALGLLGERAAEIQPILITVDPERDTPEMLAEHVPKIHPRLVGLTGTEEQLAAAAKAYRVESKVVGKSWKGDTIISHGSYIYLMDPEGNFATLLPPVLDPETMAKTIENYL